MTVYVDDMRASFRGMTMCHMMADTLEELHAMADAIGVNRRYFQDDERFPHYDLSQSKRRLAIHWGAAEITTRELVNKFSPTKKEDHPQCRQSIAPVDPE